jgi:hypothetical protein
MDLSTAIDNPRINVFDIFISNGKITHIETYKKPGDTNATLSARHQRNLQRAATITKRKFIK